MYYKYKIDSGCKSSEWTPGGTLLGIIHKLRPPKRGEGVGLLVTWVQLCLRGEEFAFCDMSTSVSEGEGGPEKSQICVKSYLKDPLIPPCLSFECKTVKNMIFVMQ